MPSFVSQTRQYELRMNYKDELNSAQHEAALNGTGPMVIIAGAGSGKTRVLTYRIAYLIDSGLDPHRIMALTFTNKAANEMRERIEGMIGLGGKDIWMGTFHSTFAKILRIESEKLGYDRNFTIYDVDDTVSMMKRIIGNMELDDKIYKPKNMLYRISQLKNSLISPEQYKQLDDLILEDETSRRPEFSNLYETYCLECFKASAMDFDDLLFNTYKLFNNPNTADILYKYQNKFQYILIDEFQDTNYAQYAIVKRMADIHQNVCVVGDDAQSIYAFRGANINNILNFDKEFHDSKVFRLEQNYRSSGNIVQAANTLIQHNTKQIPKKLWTSNDDGAKIKVVKAFSDTEEANLVANAIFHQMSAYNLQGKHFAILYRTNTQSRSLEEALRKRNLTYQIIGGISFYQRREIKDALAYLRFVVNPNDIEAFRRIINYPKRAIGKQSVNQILTTMNEHGLTLWDTLNDLQKYFGKKAFVVKVNAFLSMIKLFMSMLDKVNAYELTNRVIKDAGIFRDLYEDKTPEGKNRYDNLMELLAAVENFVRDEENKDRSLVAFLERVTLITSQDESDDKDNKVKMMTVHLSKGLEFEYVYLVGLEENLFPSFMMKTLEEVEEERRLCYVAITRAKKFLQISYALQRFRYGETVFCEPSRFLEEIDPIYLDGAGYTNASIKSKAKTYSGTSIANVADFKPSLFTEIAEGQRVRHIKFGDGAVTDLKIKGKDRIAKVKFDKVGEKTLVLNFARLMIIQ